MTIEIYTRESCKFCAAAKRLLEKRKLPYQEVQLGSDPQLSKKIEEMTRQTTTPRIFIDGKHIGGFDDLVELDQDGKLG